MGRVLRCILLLTMTVLSSACPEVCVCKWKGGKQTVECVNKGLLAIPDGIDAGSQVLDISGNTLQMLQRTLFVRLGLINLQKIYLARSRIGHLDDLTFQGLTNLIELDLSDNLLTSVPTGVLGNVPALMRLILSRNTIQRIPSGAFKSLKDLTTLELSQCEIVEIEDGAFTEMRSLEWLKLDGNHIKTLNGQRVLPRTLHGIDLHGNPWRCDCKLTGLRNWLVDSNVPNAVESQCASPERLESKPIRAVDVVDFACNPEITPSSMFLEIAAGRNVSLSCKARGEPKPKIDWYFKGERVTNLTNDYGRLWYLVTNSDDTENEAKSELYIAETSDAENGTFKCMAENRAGSSESNFTLRVITKFEEPVTLPSSFNYVYVAVGAGIAFSLIAILILIVIFWRCCCHRADRLKSDTPRKMAPSESKESTLSSISAEKNPTQIELKQSPDLINDTERDPRWCSVNNTSSSITDVRWVPGGSYAPPHPQAYFKPLDMSGSEYSGIYAARTASTTSEEKHLDREGFPVDYGLPRPPKPDFKNQHPYTIQSMNNYENFPDESAYNFSDFDKHGYQYAKACLPDQKYSETLGRMKPGYEVRYDERYQQEIPVREEYHLNTYDIYPSPPDGYKTSQLGSSQNVVKQGTLHRQVVNKNLEIPNDRPPHESPDEGYDETADGTEI